MARHRDIRNMDYADDYDGYDDIYGHSLDDDYYISPSNRQFIYNRESSRDARFEHEDDIQEVDEIDELSDTDRAKLNSCIEEIKNTLGPTVVSRTDLTNLILKYKYNIELVINALLENTNDEKPTVSAKEKDVTELFCNNLTKKVDSAFPDTIPSEILKTNEGLNFNIPIHFNKKQGGSLSGSKGFAIPNVFGSMPVKSNAFEGQPSVIGSPKAFAIPNIFGSKSVGSSSPHKGSPINFSIPNIFGSDSSGDSPKINTFSMAEFCDDPKDTNEDFSTLSDLVSSHLKTSISVDMPCSSASSAVNIVSQKISDMQLSDFTKETKSLTSNKVKNDFHIDLSKALKATSSLPNFSYKNKENVSEKFDIPFIDSDIYFIERSKNSLVKRTALPCTLDISKLININLKIGKKCSKFGKVICRKYRHRREGIISSSLSLKYPVIPKKIKVFKFDTQSPDDYISSHLKRK